MTTTPQWVARAGLGAGALCVSASAVLLGLAATTPATASVMRCLFAAPVVAVLARRERRRAPLTRRAAVAAVACGALFAGDTLLWTQAIPEVGAGLSTVLVNAQIALVPLLAWLIDRERVRLRFVLALPAVAAGVVLAGGVFERGLTGTDPVIGTVHAVGAALCYSGFLFLLRRGGLGGQPLQTYAVVLATSAAVSAAVGPWWHGLDLAPGWPAVGWLLLVTLTGQLLGWLLVACLSPRLPTDVGSALLLLTPVGAVALGAVVLSERPSVLQLAGCGLILAAGYLGTADFGAPRRFGPSASGHADLKVRGVVRCAQ
ncbi:DMT family transporter [Mycobacterium sp.]|uniref:DMT family transporter n=1 Tax=Mycobacterium sp. TaxID=1785 RepID=UPI002D232C9B|nr:DMT family transporter [Mycobacterium sp.]HZA12505.1 DMT family transporter [Mycobacterium sp.]